jgi:hypothetical protein
MLLTKIFHVEVWPNPTCATDGTLRYHVPTFKLFDAGQHAKRTQQPRLDNIAKFKGRPGGTAARPAADSLHFWEFREPGNAPGPQFAALAMADGRRYAFAAPQRYNREWGPSEAPRLLLMSVKKAPPLPFTQTLPGTHRAPPSDVYMYRVGEPLPDLPASTPRRCGSGGTVPPEAANKLGEWQMWLYEKRRCFLGFCLGGIWTDERLCENESWFHFGWKGLA